MASTASGQASSTQSKRSTASSASVSGAPQPAHRLVVLGGSGQSESCRTFIFRGESHTLGNALKNVILQNPSVTFCGYSIPHPAEDQMYLRIQTVEGVAAQDALKKGFQDLKGVCEATKKKFNKATAKYYAQNPDKKPQEA